MPLMLGGGEPMGHTDIFLGTLGYQGPAPANMLEASRLIEELLGQKER